LDVSGLSGVLADAQAPVDHALGGTFHTADTLANLNALVSDATLDSTTDPRDPTLHGSTHQSGGTDELNVTGLSGDLADAQDPKAHASTHTRQGTDTLAVDELGGDDYIYAGSFPGADPDARLDNALAAAGLNNTIHLEGATYTKARTFTDSGIHLHGVNRKTVIDASYELAGQHQLIKGATFDAGSNGSITVTANACRLLNLDPFGILPISTSAGRTYILNSGVVDVTFESGSLGCMITMCNANITDNGTDNQIGVVV
jgi:hypothetical protein